MGTALPYGELRRMIREAPRPRRSACLTQNLTTDAFYDKGSTFPLFLFSEGRGFLTPNRRKINLCFEKGRVCVLGPWEYSSGCIFDFC